MRQFEDMPLDPDVLADLEAIDRTLEGLSVDPFHAELAELSLLLVSERDLPSEDFSRALDARAARRFLTLPQVDGSEAKPARRRRSWRMPSMQMLGIGLTGAFALATAGVVVGTGALSSGGGAVAGLRAGRSQFAAKRTDLASHSSTATDTTQTVASVVTSGAGGLALTSGTPATTAAQKHAGTRDFGTASGAHALEQENGSAYAPAAAPSPVTSTAHHVVQSAQLQLTTPNAHIDQVAQEIFNVVGLEDGTVQNSHVTQANGSGNESYANFSLSIPTSNLQETMTRLSDLHYAVVASRTDGVQNVSGQYSSDQHNIADEKATRLALLKQLANAYTQTEIDSIQAQLKLAERQLAADENALASLQHRISYSSLNVQVNAGPIFPVVVHKNTTSKGFTIGKAAHDAGRVLIVMAGVALIALAVMLPLGLVLALLAWVGFWIRNRRREHALDAG